MNNRFLFESFNYFSSSFLSSHYRDVSANIAEFLITNSFNTREMNF